MAATCIVNPGFGGVNAGSAADRYAGVNSVRSDGTTAARHEANLQAAIGYCDVPTYVVNWSVAATAALDILLLVAPANKVLRLRRIVLVNPGAATAAAVVDLQLGTATGTGTGGAAASVVPVDSYARVGGVTGGPDVAQGSARVGDTTQAAGYAGIYDPLCSVSVPAAAAGFTPQVLYDARDSQFKPVTASNGGRIVFRTPSVGAGATGLRGYAEFTVDDA